MLLQELNDLKEGDQVVYTGDGFQCDVGTILTREKCWMDDDLCVKFNFTDTERGVKDHHFFHYSEVEFIETGIKE